MFFPDYMSQTKDQLDINMYYVQDMQRTSFYLFFQILTTVNNLKFMSEGVHDKLKKVRHILHV